MGKREARQDILETVRMDMLLSDSRANIAVNSGAQVSIISGFYHGEPAFKMLKPFTGKGFNEIWL